MKKIYVLLFVLMLSVAGFSQNVTVNPGTGSYATLQAAFAAINNGTHTGAIILTIEANTIETASAILNASGSGSASYTSITISPVVGGGLKTISGAVAGAGLIELNGADNVTINGLNTGGDLLEISNSSNSTTAGTSTIRLRNDATNNTITKCRVLGATTTALGVENGNIVIGTGTTTGNDNNTVSNCLLGPVTVGNPLSRCIHLGGGTGAAGNADPGLANSGIVVTGNEFFDYYSNSQFSAGINVVSGTVGATISNNKFYQTTIKNISSQTHTGIRIVNVDGFGYQITGNTIGYASGSGTGKYSLQTTNGTTTFFLPITVNVSTNTSLTPTSIQGNTITEIAMSEVTPGVNGFGGTGASAPFRGINIIGGVVNIGNVTGNTIGSTTATGSISMVTGATVAADMVGIFINGVQSVNASNNSIGGISGSNSNATPAAVNIYGIRSFNAAATGFNCTNNTIGGNVANSIESTSPAAASIVQGITNASAPATISGNIIRNLSAAGGTGTGSTASVIGINNNAAISNHTISNNTIYNLSNSSAADAVVVTGIQFTGSTGTNLVERNFIYALFAATNNAAAEVNGIRTAGGTTTYQNNMIALGAGLTNAFGASASNTGTSGINGINELLGTNNFWHNSVYIGGAPTTGSGASYAFNGTQVTETRSFRNNIFFNGRANSGSTGKNYAIKINGTAANPAGLTINNNIYFVNGGGGVFGYFNGADVATLSAWKIAVGQDLNSFESNPQFIGPGNPIPNLHINATVASDADNTGANLGVVNDFDGDTRTSTPDIGADEYVSLSCVAVGGTASASPAGPFCGSGSTTISVTGYSTVTGTTYVWQSSTNPSFTTPVNIGTPSTTYSNLNTGTITSTTYYRLKVACAGDISIDYSNIITVTIDPNSVGGTANSNQTICTGQTPANITLSDQTGNVIRWEYSVDAGFTSPVTIANTTTTLTSAEIGALTADRWFRAVVQSGSCASANSASVKVTVNPNNTIHLTSAAGTNSQTLCVNTPITTITYSTTGASGATFSGLPTGVTGNWNANVVTINGTPSVPGNFNYTVTLTGGCGTVTANGSISVTALTIPTFTQLGAYCVGATPDPLPATSINGITGSWSPSTINTSTAGTTTYTFTPNAGQCADVATMTITVSSGTIVPVFTQMGPYCIGTTPGTLPANSNNGIVGIWSPATISTALAGTFTYTFTPNPGQCANTTTMDITINPNNTITLSSAAGTNAQTLCVNTAITTITYTTTGATGATISGLPTGVSGSWNANVVTISGTPSLAGNFNYTVSLTGGCGTITANGTITVNPNVTGGTVSGTSPLCANATATYASTGTPGGTWSSSNTAIATVNPTTGLVTAVATGTVNIIYTVSSGCGAPASANASLTVTPPVSAGTINGATPLCIGATATYTTNGNSGGTWSSSNIAIATVNPTTGLVTAVAAGTVNITYTISVGCGAPVSASRSLTVNPNNTITLTSGVGTNTQAACINRAITTITYSTTGATGASISGLPAGVTGNWASNVVTISGTPTAIGTFNYTVTLTGGCGTVAATGSISVSANINPTFTQQGPFCQGAMPGALPSTSNNGIAGTWSPATINTASAGTTTYTFTPAAGVCATIATMNITITPTNTITLTSAAGTNTQSVCVGSSITTITYTTTGNTGATFAGLPAGVTGSRVGNLITINGTPSVTGTFNYTVTLTGGCGTITAAGSIIVNALPTVSIQASANPVLAPHQTISLTATASAASGNYQWFKNGVTVAGVNTPSLSNLNYADLGTYKVLFTDLNGCAATSNSIILASQEANELFIWPNPNNGQFQIKFDGRINEVVSVKIYNPLSQLLSDNDVRLSTNNESISVTLRQPLVAGVYTVHVIGAYGRKKWVGRVVVGQ